MPLEKGIESVKYRLKGDLIITVFPFVSCKFIPYEDIIYPKLIKYFTFELITSSRAQDLIERVLQTAH